MNSLRKVFFFFVAALLTAFALPALADGNDEKFSLVISPALPTVVTTPPASVTATIKNLVYDDDRIRSFKITSPAGVLITSASIPGVLATNIAIAADKLSVSVKNISISKGNSLTATLGTTFPAAASCGNNTYTWGAQAWEGTFGGDTFALDPATSKRITSISAACKYSLTGLPATVGAGTSTNLTTITYKNLAPAGPSIQSLSLSVAGGLKLSAPSVPSGTPNITNAGTTLEITGLSIGPGQSYVLTGLTVTADPSCVAPPNNTWNSPGTAAVYTGTPVGTGIAFQPDAGSAGVTTTITAQLCTMSFTTDPKDTLSGGYLGSDANPVTVLVSPVSAFAGKSITLTPSGGALGGTKMVAVSGAGVATFPSLTFTGDPGSYTLGASTGVTGDPTATSKSFAVAAAQPDPIDCVGTPIPDGDKADVAGLGTSVLAQRGLNKDGATCKLVVYDLAIIGANKFKFVWDTNNQGTAAFSYDAQFAPAFVDPDTGLPKVIQLAWTLVSPGNPNWVDGRNCLSATLPAVLGTVTSDGGSTTIVVNAASPPTAPFPIVIGNERLMVTAIAGSNWTVLRAQGGTGLATHSAGSPVMSTPFPLDGAGNQVPMCIASRLDLTQPASACSPQNANLSCVGTSALIFDEGDGFVKGPQ